MRLLNSTIPTHVSKDPHGELRTNAVRLLQALLEGSSDKKLANRIASMLKKDRILNLLAQSCSPNSDPVNFDLWVFLLQLADIDEGLRDKFGTDAGRTVVCLYACMPVCLHACMPVCLSACVSDGCSPLFSVVLASEYSSCMVW